MLVVGKKENAKQFEGSKSSAGSSWLLKEVFSGFRWNFRNFTSFTEEKEEVSLDQRMRKTTTKVDKETSIGSYHGYLKFRDECTFTRDASIYGIGALLTPKQNAADRVAANASQTKTKSRKNYSAIEVSFQLWWTLKKKSIFTCQVWNLLLSQIIGRCCTVLQNLKSRLQDGLKNWGIWLPNETKRVEKCTSGRLSVTSASRWERQNNICGRVNYRGYRNSDVFSKSIATTSSLWSENFWNETETR